MPWPRAPRASATERPERAWRREECNDERRLRASVVREIRVPTKSSRDETSRSIGFSKASMAEPLRERVVVDFVAPEGHADHRMRGSIAAVIRQGNA